MTRRRTPALGIALVVTIAGCSEAANGAANGDAGGDATGAATGTTISGDDRGARVEWRHAFFGVKYGGPGTILADAEAPPPSRGLALVVTLTNRADYCEALGTLRRAPVGATDPSLTEGTLGFEVQMDDVPPRSPRYATAGGGAVQVELEEAQVVNGDAPYGPAGSAASRLQAGVSITFYDVASKPDGSARGRMNAVRCEYEDYGYQ